MQLEYQLESSEIIMESVVSLAQNISEKWQRSSAVL